METPFDQVIFVWRQFLKIPHFNERYCVLSVAGSFLKHGWKTNREIEKNIYKEIKRC